MACDDNSSPSTALCRARWGGERHAETSPGYTHEPSYKLVPNVSKTKVGPQVRGPLTYHSSAVAHVCMVEVGTVGGCTNKALIASGRSRTIPVLYDCLNL